MNNNNTPNSYSPLLTDFYQFTMAYGYWQLGMHNRDASFNLLFRKSPFDGNYAVSCGMQSVIDFIQNWHFKQDDIDYLATIINAKGSRMFSPDFLDYLASLEFNLSIEAIPEGTVVFPHEPILRVHGPLLQCQLLETPLLNILNFQTLIATKASRVCEAAAGDPVIEFGLRRSQGPDGGLSASRAAYIGGCVATSNTLAGKSFGIPVSGTHAHSWVTAFASEIEAFTSYATVMPHNSVLLVDTFNTVEGVKNAIKVGKKLREQDADLLAIRLDSGDMADLSIKARKLLDDAGFNDTGIITSNSMDEYSIAELKKNGSKISSWGVGTNLITAYDQPALDGVYKMSAIKDEDGLWEYKLKLSEQEVKISNPGRHQTRRFYKNGKAIGDIIYDIDMDIADQPEAVLFDAGLNTVKIDDYDDSEDLLQPLFVKGKLVQAPRIIDEIRQSAIEAYQTFLEQHGTEHYPVGLEKNAHKLKMDLIKKWRG